MSLRIILGTDPDDIEWQDFALCSGMPINTFYDDYESDPTFAKTVDEICLACPVQRECLLAGAGNNEHGVWGGIYLTSGNPDDQRNAHKTPKIWKMIRDKTA